MEISRIRHGDVVRRPSTLVENVLNVDDALFCVLWNRRGNATPTAYRLFRFGGEFRPLWPLLRFPGYRRKPSGRDACRVRTYFPARAPATREAMAYLLLHAATRAAPPPNVVVSALAALEFSADRRHR